MVLETAAVASILNLYIVHFQLAAVDARHGRAGRVRVAVQHLHHEHVCVAAGLLPDAPLLAQSAGGADQVRGQAIVTLLKSEQKVKSSFMK